ncbi:MAG: hypothetical protein RR320_04485, partial [Oscillospiraceae bacterium]
NFDGTDGKNPFAIASEQLGTVRVTGIISNSNGKSTAIIETESASFIVSVGDTVPGSSWSISDIGKNSVTFSGKESSKTIYMDGNTIGNAEVIS